MILTRRKQYVHLLMNGMCMSIRCQKLVSEELWERANENIRKRRSDRKLKVVLMCQERMLVNII